MPSIIYLSKNKTINGYSGQNYYFLENDGILFTILGVIIFLAILIGMFVIYLKLIKKSECFKNLKDILVVAFFVGLVFLICLPNTSQDVFYYMGSGRVLSDYSQNPYYVTISDVLYNIDEKDDILSNSGVWDTTTVVYGPIWVLITVLLNKFSLSSITLLLYEFKIANLIMYLLTIWIIYKLTGKKKFAVMFAFNPLIIMEFLVNCHNDIYMIFFIMLAMYFIKNKKNIWLGIIAIAISVAIKYISLLIFPFLIFYHIKNNVNSKNNDNKHILKNIGIACFYSIILIILLLAMYLPDRKSVV